MDIGRRPILQGLAAAGVAATAARSAEAEGTSTKAGTPDLGRMLPLTVILGGSPFDASFLAGIRAAAAPDCGLEPFALRLEGLGPAGLGRLAGILAPGQGATVLGLVDDGTGAVAVELARAAGARMAWLGHHWASGSGASRHRILTAAAEGCGAWFANQLAACGDNFSFIEQPFAAAGLERGPSTAEEGAVPAGARIAGDWATALGAALVPGGAMRLPPLGPPPIGANPAPHPVHLVSFAFAV